MCKIEEYYTENEVNEMVDDMESLDEYLYGWDDAILNGNYKRKYVDVYRNRG